MPVGPNSQWGIGAILAALAAAAVVVFSSIQTTTIELGHASDTTFSRTGAGDAAIEGNAIYRASGTDVPVADGGSGRSTATAYMPLAGGTTATGAHQSVATGNAGESLKYVSSSALAAFGRPLSPANFREAINDFLQNETNNSSQPEGNVATSGSGAGANATWSASVGGEPGVYGIDTGSTNSGHFNAFLFNSNSAIEFGTHEWTAEWRLRLPALSSADDTFVVVAGFGDTAGATQTDGCYVRYTHSVNSGKFECVTESNTTETATDSGITVAIDTWYKCRVVVNAAASSVAFYINDALVQTNTTNIPTGTARACTIRANMAKNGGAVGTTENTLYLGHVYWCVAFSTAR